MIMKSRIALALSCLFLIFCFADVGAGSTVEAKSSTTQNNDSKVDIPHSNAGWKKTSLGPLDFKAPSKWYVEPGFYTPAEQDDDYCGYYIFVGYFEDDFIEDYVEDDKKNYDDVEVEDEEFGGYPAKFVGYTYYDAEARDGGEYIICLNYYIQLSTKGGTCVLTYDAPADEADEFVEDFYVVVNSLEINESRIKNSSESKGSFKTGDAAKAEVETHEYIANKNTKKFHYPYCGSVSSMSEKNKWYYEGSRDELISKGYQPCKKCNP